MEHRFDGRDFCGNCGRRQYVGQSQCRTVLPCVKEEGDAHSGSNNAWEFMVSKNPGAPRVADQIHEIEFPDGSYIRYQVAREDDSDLFERQRTAVENAKEQAKLATIRAERAEAALARANAERVALSRRLDLAVQSRSDLRRQYLLLLDEREALKNAMLKAGWTWDGEVGDVRPPVREGARRIAGKLERALFLLRRLNWHEAANDIENNIPLRGAVRGKHFDSGVVE